MIATQIGTQTAKTATPRPERQALSLRYLDFWLIGGLSLAVWLVAALAQLVRDDHSFVAQRFQAVAGAFALLSLVCNHPHFVASYRMAYGRGPAFCLRHWWAMIAVPALLVGLYAFAYFHFGDSVEGAAWAVWPNRALGQLGLGFRFAQAPNLGIELLGISIWIMNLTVGWHYSKQAYGCALVYANYDGYYLTPMQKRVTKGLVFAIAFYGFCYLYSHWRDYMDAPSFQYQGIPLAEIGLPGYLPLVAGTAVLGFAAAFLHSVVYRNRRHQGKWPSANFLVPLVAFAVWWMPLFKQREYYLMMVPFFHSLQYLPFAARMEMSEVGKRRNPESALAARTLLLLVAGFFAFEAVPGVLDEHLSSYASVPIFFTVAFAVFINVHHFFLDAVLWRFQEPGMREVILGAGDPRRRPVRPWN